MNKGMLHTLICCLALVLFTSVSCATKNADMASMEAPPEQVAMSEPAPAPVVAEQVTEGTAVAGEDGEEASGYGSSTNMPNVSVNVVQVNKKENPVKASEKEDAAEMVEDSSAEPERQKPRAMRARTGRVPTRYNVFQYMPDTSKSLGTETLLSEISKEIAGKVFYELKEEGERNFTAKVAVVNAVPLADFKRESEFGRIMGEYILTDLADRGLKVTELRMGKEINILPQTGEFIMSRNIGELATNAPTLDYVVVSTFTNTRKTLIVQGRLVSLKDGLVKTSWRYGMPLNRELLGLFHSVEPPFKIAVKGMGQ
jgi:hypothetical protein